MRRTRPRYPKPKEIAEALRSLQLIPVDEKAEMHWRLSERSVPNLRYKAVTAGCKWMVDIYSGTYFCVRFESKPTEICKTLPSLMFYLYRVLKLRNPLAY